MTTKKIQPILSQDYITTFKPQQLPSKKDIDTLLVHNNQVIVKVHYGYTDLLNTQQDSHLYVFPIDINQVRPKVMNDDQMQLGSTLVRANDQYPGAQAQEQNLLVAVQKNSKADLKKIKHALEIIKCYHGLEKRKSGEPFYLHPIAVAKIVLSYNQDEETIIAALLHDTVEDTTMLLENIEMLFGKSVTNLVDGLTHLESKKEMFTKVNLAKHENFSTLLEVQDKRVLYIKLADRLHNMRTLGVKSYASQHKKADETLKFFVPLAKYLKLEDAAQELKYKILEILDL